MYFMVMLKASLTLSWQIINNQALYQLCLAASIDWCLYQAAIEWPD